MHLSNFKEELRQVKAFAFDVDGVLSHTVMPLHPNGEPMRTVNIKDGYALQLAVRKGYPVGIITGGRTDAVRSRFENLGVTDIYMGASYKKDSFLQFLRKNDLDPAHVLYMGDDLPDYEIMQMVGFPTAPADAVTEIKQSARYISWLDGGMGCVRDVIEQVLRLHNKWMDGDAFHW